MSSCFIKRRAAPTTVEELMVRARALQGRSVAELAAGLGIWLPTENRRAKGHIGQLVEMALGADPLAGDSPDFSGLGIELKTIPINKRGRPSESTFVCSIDLKGVADETWENSRLRRRLAHVLWVPVDAATVAPLPERRFGHPRLWQPTADQWQTIKTDWEMLVGLIGIGDSERLTAYHGQVLQVRPKAADSHARRWVPGADGPQRGLPVGFYLRSHFTTRVLSSPDER
jgi:DNA mismatch repair protein MutH